jgi:predicted DCC family thiol-disulfide oxidoreductase YuxK
VTDTLPARLVLYDGDCGVCNGAVQFLLRTDPDPGLHFAPLQGETTVTLRSRHPEIPEGLDTMVYLQHGRVFLRSRAALALASALPFPWRAAGWLRVLPAGLTDRVYRLVAALRYWLGGRADQCRLATADEAERFLP